MIQAISRAALVNSDVSLLGGPIINRRRHPRHELLDLQACLVGTKSAIIYRVRLKGSERISLHAIDALNTIFFSRL